MPKIDVEIRSDQVIVVTDWQTDEVIGATKNKEMIPMIVKVNYDLDSIPKLAKQNNDESATVAIFIGEYLGDFSEYTVQLSVTTLY